MLCKNDGEISPSAEGGEVEPPVEISPSAGGGEVEPPNLLKAKRLARSLQKAFVESANTHFSLEAKQQIKKAIIPAAGLGTRMQHLAKNHSKEMLSIGGRPMIFYAILEAVLSGLEELYIIINSRKDALCRYLESEDLWRDIRSKKKGKDIFWPQLTFVEQPTPAGSGDAIFRARELVGDEPFALMMPDFVFFGDTPALSQLMPLYERLEGDVVGLLLLQGKEVEGFGNVGLVQGEKREPGLVTIRSVSPKTSDPLVIKEDEHILKAVPRWIPGPHFFSYLERTKGEGEWDDTPALQMLCTERQVVGKVLNGKGFDVGNPVGYQAAEHFAAHLDGRS